MTSSTRKQEKILYLQYDFRQFVELNLNYNQGLYMCFMLTLYHKAL